MQVPANSDARQSMILDAGSANSNLAARGYKVDSKGGFTRSETKAVEPMVNEKAGTHITITLTPTSGQMLNYLVSGTTDCLILK
jgi:hypothetical protein